MGDPTFRKNLAILVHDDVEVLDFCGPFEAFGVTGEAGEPYFNVFTVAEDAMSNVPRALRAASDALGASRWQTASRLVLPAASPGIFAAVMLGFGRAIGETMIVLMASGNAAVVELFDPTTSVRTVTATIAAELGEVAQGDAHWRVLFLLGTLLFVVTFVVNSAAELVRQRLRQRYARL